MDGMGTTEEGGRMNETKAAVHEAQSQIAMILHNLQAKIGAESMWVNVRGGAVPVDAGELFRAEYTVKIATEWGEE